MVEGFKNTEVGVIPEDWDVKSIEELCVPSGLVRGPFGGALKKEFFVTYGYKVYEQKNAIYSDVTLGRYYIDSLKFNELRRFELKEGDFIISCSGTIGKICQIPKNFEKGIINQALLKLTLNCEQNSDKYFLQYFRWNNFQANIIDSTQGGAMKNLIGMSDYKKTKIPLPPTKAEQTAIATALNDADALISSLEKLIAKKKAIKQGAMQELLKPKENWETKTLGEVSKFRRGTFPQPYGLDKWYDDNNGFPFIQVYDVDYNMKLKADTKRHISEEAQKMSVFVEKGSILLTIQGSIGRIAMTQYDAYVDRTLLLFESYKIPFNKYFFMLLVYVLFEQEKQNAPGGTIKTITKQVLANFNISYPNIKEQNHIAEILSDMDIEILRLEDKLEKLKQLKQGMMQSLLTGKIRLV